MELAARLTYHSQQAETLNDPSRSSEVGRQSIWLSEQSWIKLMPWYVMQIKFCFFPPPMLSSPDIRLKCYRTGLKKSFPRSRGLV